MTRRRYVSICSLGNASAASKVGFVVPRVVAEAEAGLADDLVEALTPSSGMRLGGILSPRNQRKILCEKQNMKSEREVV